ncbi:MAG TPA: penicillin-binding protein 1B, partial [Alcanivorax sp.]|nr:penicillin-binding protein 1B [Alcanivorax sp.]
MAKNAKKPASARKGSARRPAKSGNKRNNRSAGRRWFSWRFIAKVSVVLLVLAAAGLAYLDAYVRDRFDSHVWQLPARVYARPVELYPGRVLARNDMLKMLELMRYRRAGGAPTPGSYTTDGNTLVIHTRGFRDSDGGEPAQRIRVTLGGGQISALDSNDGDSLARLEPLQIGSIHPGHTEDRVFVPLDRVPPLLVQMLLATEDRDFYEHHGVSPRGLARAMVANV